MVRKEACKFDFCRERFRCMVTDGYGARETEKQKKTNVRQNDDFLSKRKFDDENFHFSYI